MAIDGSAMGSANRSAASAGTSVIPQLWYPDPDAAASFLERAFRFQPHSKTPGEDGGSRITLRVGRGFVFLGPARTPRFVFRTPREANGVNTGAIYIAVGDVDGLYRRSRDAGAEIASELQEMSYGSREFAARDHHGYLWSFGTYRPTSNGGNVSNGSRNQEDVFDILRYERPKTAMEWLAEAFGFTSFKVVEGYGENIRHALVGIGENSLMIGQARTDDPLKILPPQMAGTPHLSGVHTQTIHVVVVDPEAHCTQAKQAGAAILEPPATIPSGARRYIARDPEGYVWRFSTYSPDGATANARSA